MFMMFLVQRYKMLLVLFVMQMELFWRFIPWRPHWNHVVCYKMFCVGFWKENNSLQHPTISLGPCCSWEELWKGAQCYDFFYPSVPPAVLQKQPVLPFIASFAIFTIFLVAIFVVCPFVDKVEVEAGRAAHVYLAVSRECIGAAQQPFSLMTYKH